MVPLEPMRLAARVSAKTLHSFVDSNQNELMVHILNDNKSKVFGARKSPSSDEFTIFSRFIP